ncbi:MAG: carboxypeptidase-like regulatory domain-containing protein [Candidatus Methanoplasma sp.]|jgi:hypothetical protein|nr:carboxypeptidase-like regulatory domain-containing protein [Candidatus Methanoplasma sp.]
MRDRFLLAIIALVLLIPMTSFVSSASAGADLAAAPTATANYYIEGYVAEGGGTGKIPMKDVTVTITDNLSLTYQNTTDANGFFSIGIGTNTNLMISFKIYGYTIITCPNTSVQSGTDNLILDLSTARYNSATHTYTITSSVDDMQCAIMAASDGIVRGVVSFDGGPIRNAAVSLIPTDRAWTLTTHADSRGYYEITCPTGTYIVTASSRGFDKSEGISVNVTSSPSTVNVTMEKSELKKYLGLDAAHILMLIGVIVGIMLAAAAWFLSKRMNGPHPLERVDDSAIEDDDIRYP